MPRRSAAHTTTTTQEHAVQPSSAPPPPDALHQNLVILRTQWKWAAFSQFFFTFAHLFNMEDVGLMDIEDDLVRGSCIVLPRIMVRLLNTMSYGNKVNLDNWQTALRKQYYKRNPLANPIGPEPQTEEPIPSSPLQEPHKPTPEPDAALDELPSDERKSTTHTTEVGSPEGSKDATIEQEDRVPSLQPEGGRPEQEEQSRQQSPNTMHDEEGDKQESLDWLDLPMLIKLDSMHIVTEWQFDSPLRFRTLMRSDDDTASWRIEPIGYDNKRNAYWLIGADRLWLQRVIPSPPKSLKRKRPTQNKPSTSKAKAKVKPPKRPRLQKEDASKPEPPKLVNANGTRGRAAKAQANLKLDAQAKELAELNREAAALASSSNTPRRFSGRQSSTRGPINSVVAASSGGTALGARPIGTRISARLRGAQDDEWQPVPEEWLNEDEEKSISPKKTATNGHSTRNGKQKILKTGLESDGDSISDLTDLSEISDGEEAAEESQEPVAEEPELSTDDRGLEEQPILPEGFIEWETICVTLYDWEHIAERFEKATHYSEKALYKVLVNNIVPIITEELREIERKKRLDEALVHRKRSSRIQIRETEKEEAKAAAIKRAEEEEKQSRARRLEARQQKEEAERIKRETAREQRRKEREAKEEAQKRKDETPSSESQVDVVGESSGKITLLPNPGASQQKNGRKRAPVNGTASGSRTPLGDDWELDCEICHRRGVNIDDGTPMMCCGSCSKWQHIACHDRHDQLLGRPKCNWDVVEFFCYQCRLKKAPSHASYASGPSRQALPTGQNPYLALQSTTPSHYNQYSGGSTVSYARQPDYASRNYSSTSMNGTSSYSQNISNVRPTANPSTQHPSLPPQQTTISFSHYQPHQRGFSSQAPVQTPYYPSGDVRSHNQQQVPGGAISQHGNVHADGHATHSYQRSLPPLAPQWNASTLAQSQGYSGGYNGARPNDAAYRRDSVHASGDHPPAATTYAQWQPPAQPTGVPNGPPQVPSTAAQFRYHPASYQSPT